MIIPVAVSCEPPSFAIPKSSRRTSPRLSMSTFWVLRSRWMMPTSWIAWSPAAISSATSNAPSAIKPPCTRTTSLRSVPLISSIEM